MKLSTQPYKGTRDFYPEDKRFQKWMFSQWREVAESFGYEEYDAPLIEPLELYKAKTGEEIVNEQTYVFDDRGGRKVTIRPEMTPTVNRMVAARKQELSYPLRLYSIPNVWRYERPQRGRLREHWQLNIDLFGVSGLQAEIEMIDMASALMHKFGATKSMFTININSRKLINYILKSYLKLSAKSAHDLSKLIDKMHKFTKSEFDKQLKDIVSTRSKREEVSSILKVKSIEELPDKIKNHSSTQQLNQLLLKCKNRGISNIVFDISLMRGFDYYTDIVFEIFDTDSSNNRSLFGGGRYDGLVSMFGVESVATIGFGIGDVTLENFLKTHELTPKLEPSTDLIVITVGDTEELIQPVINQLRNNKLNVAVDFSDKKLDKQLKSAQKSGVRYALVVGHDELKSGTYKLKDFTSSAEQSVQLLDIVNIINSSKDE